MSRDAVGQPGPETGTQPEFARLPMQHLAALGLLRAIGDLRAALEPDGAAVWLTWKQVSKSTLNQLRAIPRIELFASDGPTALRRLGSRLAVDQLPGVDWRPLAELIPVELPAAGLAYARTARSAIVLRRSYDEHPTTAILTTLKVLAVWVLTAPAVRMKTLRFAAAADGRALVFGEPAPPIAGERFYGGTIVVRSGWRVDPIDDPVALRELLQLNEGDLALFSPALEAGSEELADARIAIVTAAEIIPLTRGAVRATMKQRPPSQPVDSPEQPPHA